MTTDYTLIKKIKTLLLASETLDSRNQLKHILLYIWKNWNEKKYVNWNYMKLFPGREEDDGEDCIILKEIFCWCCCCCWWWRRENCCNSNEVIILSLLLIHASTILNIHKTSNKPSLHIICTMHLNLVSSKNTGHPGRYNVLTRLCQSVVLW